MFFMVVAAVYILYLLFLIVRACSELRHMPYVGKCHFTNAQCSLGQEVASHGGRSGWRLPSKWPDLQGKTQGLVLFPRAGDQHCRSLGQQGRRETLGRLNRREARGLEASWALGASVAVGVAWILPASHPA